MNTPNITWVRETGPFSSGKSAVIGDGERKFVVASVNYDASMPRDSKERYRVRMHLPLGSGRKWTDVIYERESEAMRKAEDRIRWWFEQIG